MPLVLSGFRFEPAFWLGCVLLVLLHELGHAYVVQRVRAEVVSVELHGIGGLCRWTGPTTPLERACIAWGGIWAQMVAYAAALIVVHFEGPPVGEHGQAFLDAFTRANLWIMAVNLLPVPPLDGATAWRLFPLSWRWVRGRLHLYRRVYGVVDAQRTLSELDAEEARRGGRVDLEGLDPELKAQLDAVFDRARDTDG